MPKAAMVSALGLGGVLSILMLNVGRRMVMSDTPFSTALIDQRGETRWRQHRLALLHPGEQVKAGDEDGIVVDHDYISLMLIVRFYRRSDIVKVLGDGEAANCGGLQAYAEITSAAE